MTKKLGESKTDVLEQLGELKDKLLNAPESDKAIVTEWEKLIRRAFLVQNLYGHDAVKIMFSFYETKVKGIESALRDQTSEELSTSQGVVKRVRWEALKEAYMSFVRILTRADSNVEVINRRVKENLET